MTVKKSFFAPKAKPAHAAESFVEKETASYSYEPLRRSRETKSKRLNLLITPSLHAAMLAKAQALDVSFNEACCIAMAEFVKKE